MTSEPVCRTCYLRSLPTEQAARIAAEPVTMPIYYCPEHEERAREISRIFEDAVRQGVIRYDSTYTARLTFRLPPMEERITLRIVPWYDEQAALNSWESEGGR